MDHQGRKIDSDPLRLSCQGYPGQVPLIQPEGTWGENKLARQIGHALRVPYKCDIHIVSDSTLGLYPEYVYDDVLKTEVRHGEKKWINKFFASETDSSVREPWMYCGATIQDITAGMAALSDDEVDAFDCTIVVCNLNAKQSQTVLTFEEMNGIGIHVYNLCRQCLRHKRAALIIGGSASLWGFDPKWDNMVKKCVIIARECGVPPSMESIILSLGNDSQATTMRSKRRKTTPRWFGCCQTRAICSTAYFLTAATPAWKICQTSKRELIDSQWRRHRKVRRPRRHRKV